MTRAAHGLVIGKFYPPHAGHHLLVRTAAAVCDRVTVVVMASSVESIPLALRVVWLKQVHPEPQITVVGTIDNHPVDYDDPAIWDAHVELMREAAGPSPVDAVFTSERYGDELARRFSARHVCVDLGRELTPVSGTAVRADPIAHWGMLAPPVRAHFARRVVLVGAESTGKSTVATALAQRLRSRGGAHEDTRWVPEHGRDYSVEKLALAVAEAALADRPRPWMTDLVWTTSDFERIASWQNALEDLEAGRGGPVLLCDTDAFATSVWHERYLGAPAPSVDAIAAVRRPALYLLTHHDDVPFAQDGIRDGEQVRAWMTRRFEERLTEERRPFVWLRGTPEERLRQAEAAIDAVLAKGWTLAPPLG